MEGVRAIKCGFCHLGTEVESICGKLHYDNKSTAAHRKCMQYSADLVQYKFASFGGFKIHKVEKEIQRGKRLKCSICKSDKSRLGKVQGATAGCAISKCSKSFHFYCAKLDDVAITERMDARYLKENSKAEIMYSVFCGEAHYNQFKNNKGALKNQHKQLDKNCSDEEQQSGEEEDQINELLSDSQNTQFDEDIQMSEYDHNDDRNANESSDSEQEDPLNSTSGNQRVKTVNKKGDNRAVIDSENCESYPDSDIIDDKNIRGAKVAPVPKNSSRVLNKTTEPPASSTPKRTGRGTSLKLPVQQKIITQAEIHVTTSPSSGEENTDDEATSNGVYHSSDDEPTPDPAVGGSISLSPQRATNDPERSNPFNSESELEENATFPDCAIVISSLKEVWPLKRHMIPGKAKELFDVQYAKSWSQSPSFSNQLSDIHLPHIMKIVADMVRNEKFKELGQLLTDCNYQLSQMESINHLLSLDDDALDHIRKSLLDGIKNQELNGEVVLRMDSKLNTLFLKLNKTVDRDSKIRNQLFPNVKELSGCLYEWKGSTVSAITPNPSDVDFEWKGINAWLNKECWDSCERCIYPAQDIFLAAVENKSIEKLIECHFSKEVKNTQRKLFFVRAMDDMVNLDMFLQRLIGSCANHRNALIISHAKPPVTLKSLLPSSLRKGIVVKVMSAFEPSNKQGISVVVISVSNPNWQQQQRSSGSVPATASDDEITPCPEDNVPRDRKRKTVKTGDSFSKRKRKS